MLCVHAIMIFIGYGIISGNLEDSSVERFSDPIEGSSSPPTAEVFSIPDSFKEGKLVSNKGITIHRTIDASR